MASKENIASNYSSDTRSQLIMDETAYAEIVEDENKLLRTFIEITDRNTFFYDRQNFPTDEDGPGYIQFKEVFVYVFRKTGDYGTLYAEYYVNPDGKYEEYDVTDSDNRPSTGVVLDSIVLLPIEEGHRYTYYIWVSPFRLSFNRMNALLEMVRKYSNSYLMKYFTLCYANDFIISNPDFIDNVLKRHIYEPIKIVTELYAKLVDRQEELAKFLAPSDEDSKKILLLSNLINERITNGPGKYKRELRNRKEDEEYIETLEPRVFGFSNSYGDDFEYNLYNAFKIKLDLYDAEKDFKYTNYQTFIKWRYDYELRKNYLMGQVELYAAEIIRWLKDDRMSLALTNLVFGSFSGSSASRASININQNFTMNSIKNMIFTNQNFSEEEGGNLFEAFIGLVFDRLDQTEVGNAYLADIVKNGYMDVRNSSGEFSEFYEMIDHSHNYALDAANLAIASFKLTRDLTNSFSRLISSLTVHFVSTTYLNIERLTAVSKNNVDCTLLLSETSTTLNKRDIIIKFSDTPIDIEPGSRTRTITEIYNLSDDVDNLIERRQIKNIELDSEHFTFEANNIAKVTGILDKINIGVGFFQLLLTASKNQQDIQSFLDVTGFCLDLAEFAASGAGANFFGAAGAAINTVSSAIEAGQEFHQGDNDSAIALTISALGSGAVCVGFILLAAGIAAGPVIIIGTIVAVVAGFIASFLNDDDIEMVLKHCCWGKEYPEISSSDTRKYDWSLVPLNQWIGNTYAPINSVNRKFGNLDVQINALTTAIYSFSIGRVAYYHKWHNEFRPNDPSKATGLILVEFYPGLIGRDSTIDIELSLLDLSSNLLPGTTYEFTVEPGKNMFVNLPKEMPSDPSVSLKEDAKLDKVTCIIANKSHMRVDVGTNYQPVKDRQTGIEAYLNSILLYNGVGTIYHDAESVKDDMQYIQEPSVDYFQQISNYLSRDSRVYLQAKVKLYPEGKDKSGFYIEREDKHLCFDNGAAYDD